MSIRTDSGKLSVNWRKLPYRESWKLLPALCRAEAEVQRALVATGVTGGDPVYTNMRSVISNFREWWRENNKNYKATARDEHATRTRLYMRNVVGTVRPSFHPVLSMGKFEVADNKITLPWRWIKTVYEPIYKKGFAQSHPEIIGEATRLSVRIPRVDVYECEVYDFKTSSYGTIYIGISQVEKKAVRRKTAIEAAKAAQAIETAATGDWYAKD